MLAEILNFQGAKPCLGVGSFSNYLINKNMKQPKIMLSLSDTDLDALFDKKVNLLDYLSFKKDILTMNAKNATFEMFEEKNL